MLDRNWVLYVALAGLILLVGSYFVSDSCYDGGSYKSAQSARTTPNNESSQCSKGDLTSIQRIACSLETISARQDSEEETNRAQSDLDAQWKMAYWARCLSIISIAQFVLTLLGLAAILETLKANVRSAKAAETAAKAAEKQGMDAEKIFELSEKQFRLSGRQTDLDEKQHALARLQFITANRPRLHIRHVQLIPNPREAVSKDKPLRGSFIIVNAGGTPAEIKESRCRFLVTNAPLPMNPPLDDALAKMVHLPGDAIIEGGESHEFPIESDGPLGELATKLGDEYGGYKIYMLGMLRYADIEGKERFFGFCREYNPWGDDFGEGRFLPVNDPDYEYQD